MYVSSVVNITLGTNHLYTLNVALNKGGVMHAHRHWLFLGTWPKNKNIKRVDR